MQVVFKTESRAGWNPPAAAVTFPPVPVVSFRVRLLFLKLASWTKHHPYGVLDLIKRKELIRLRWIAINCSFFFIHHLLFILELFEFEFFYTILFNNSWVLFNEPILFFSYFRKTNSAVCFITGCSVQRSHCNLFYFLSPNTFQRKASFGKRTSGYRNHQ